jgi:hypothetical protein
MGFFSKLKANLTGSWADVTIVANDATRGETATVTVNVAVRDQEISVDSIVVTLRCNEEISIPNYRASVKMQTNGQAGNSTASGSINVNHTETIHEEEVTVDSNVNFAANEKRSFQAIFQLPAHLPATFEGRNAGYVWEAYAALEMKGNDPDTGWKEIRVR